MFTLRPGTCAISPIEPIVAANAAAASAAMQFVARRTTRTGPPEGSRIELQASGNLRCGRNREGSVLATRRRLWSRGCNHDRHFTVIVVLLIQKRPIDSTNAAESF